MTMGRAVVGPAEKVRALAAAQGVDDVDGHALAGYAVESGASSRVWSAVVLRGR
jgi:hypothetical protein